MAPRKRRPCARGAHLLEIDEEVRGPEGRALAHGRRLGRLEVRVGERREVPVREGEIAQLAEDRDEPALGEREAVAHLDQVGVVGDVGGGRAPVDDAARGRRGGSEDADVRHDVVARLRLLGRGGLEVDVREVGAHLDEGLFGDGQAQPALLFGEPQPEPAPGLELELRGEDRGHLRRGIALGQRVDEGVSLHPARLLRRG